MAHLEDKQERDFERNKKVREENQVLKMNLAINKIYFSPHFTILSKYLMFVSVSLTVTLA